MFHTTIDLMYFSKYDINPESRQAREHPVPCGKCSSMTWNIPGFCNQHYDWENDGR